MRTAALAVLTASLLACAPESARRSRAGGSDLDAYCELTSTPGLVRFDGEVATVCSDAGCMVARVRGGALEPLPVSGARMGFAVSRGRTVILHDDGRLTVLERRDEIELAAWAADVAVEDDGEHVLFVGLAEAERGLAEQDVEVESGEALALPAVELVAGPELGTRIVRLDLDTAELEEVVDDPMAGTPVALSGTHDILYVAAPAGLAALMRVSPGGTPRQLTNVGVTEVGMEFVPAPQHEVTELEGRIVYAVPDAGTDAGDDEDGAPSGALWAVDVETGEAELLGEGRFPMPGADGVVATVDDTPGAGCAASYGSAEGP